jgi:hypothetical protein
LSQELYEQPRGQISQGDILELAPHIYLDTPLLGLTRIEGGMHQEEREPFRAFDDVNGQPVVAGCKRTRAIVLTPDCEIDKNITYWHICPVLPLSRLKGNVQGDVRRNRVYSRFFLPQLGEVLPDSFVDFNQISSIKADFIQAGRRILSLSDIGRQGLYAQFVRWLTRWELRNVRCPNCDTEFNPATNLQVRNN